MRALPRRWYVLSASSSQCVIVLLLALDVLLKFVSKSMCQTHRCKSASSACFYIYLLLNRVSQAGRRERVPRKTIVESIQVSLAENSTFKTHLRFWKSWIAIDITLRKKTCDLRLLKTDGRAIENQREENPPIMYIEISPFWAESRMKTRASIERMIHFMMGNGNQVQETLCV